MVKVKIQATEEDVAKAGEDLGDFVVPKPGFYVLQLVECTPGFSKDGNGEEDKSRPRLECVYEIVAEGKEQAEPKANYGRLWDYVTFSKEAGWSRARFVKAFYPDKVKDGKALDVEIDTDEVVERKVFARIKNERDKLRSEEAGSTVQRARIANLLPLDGMDSYEEAAYSSDAFGGAEDAEGGDEDPFGGSTEDAGDDLLTEEELKGYDLKELGNVAKEFDLDPTDSIVKYVRGANKGKVNQESTKEKIIAAILEAQGADDGDGGDAGGDEDPF